MTPDLQTRERVPPLADEAWADRQVQQGMSVLLREINVASQITALRRAAYGLLNTARDCRNDGNAKEAARLVRRARWHMTHSLRIG